MRVVGKDLRLHAAEAGPLWTCLRVLSKMSGHFFNLIRKSYRDD